MYVVYSLYTSDVYVSNAHTMLEPLKIEGSWEIHVQFSTALMAKKNAFTIIGESRDQFTVSFT